MVIVYLTFITLLTLLLCHSLLTASEFGVLLLECITNLCCILGRFSIFLILSEVMHVTCNSIEKHLSSIFFCRFVFHIQEITYANNCVFHCVRKEINNAFSPGANYSFRESGLQITLRLLSSSLGNTVLLHTLFLEYETQITEKKILDNVFNRIAIHMHNF